MKQLLNQKETTLFFSFRHYYRYILCLHFLDPNASSSSARRHSASTGLILASAMTLQMTTQITCSNNDKRDGLVRRATVVRKSNGETAVDKEIQLQASPWGMGYVL